MVDEPVRLSFRSVTPKSGWLEREQLDWPALPGVNEAAADALSPPTHQSISLVKQGKLFRDCLECVLDSPDRRIDSSCGTLEDLRASLAGSNVPDLIIISMTAPKIADTFAEIREFRRLYPATRWIVVSPSMRLDVLWHSVASGIEGLLYEDSLVDVLRLVTDLVLLGHSLLPAELATLLHPGSGDTERTGEPDSATPWQPTHATAGPAPSAPTGAEPFLSDAGIRPLMSLSQREDEILRCLAKGFSNKMIARDLLIAEATVKAHVKALLRKMQVVNRTQAAIAAPRFLRGFNRRHETMNATEQALPPGRRNDPLPAPSVGLSWPPTVAAL